MPKTSSESHLDLDEQTLFRGISLAMMIKRSDFLTTTRFETLTPEEKAVYTKIVKQLQSGKRKEKPSKARTPTAYALYKQSKKGQKVSREMFNDLPASERNQFIEQAKSLKSSDS